jgi:hypothetical protein
MSVRPDEPLDDCNYYLPLSDVLLDVAEARASSSPNEAAEMAGYAYAFAHDALNMAVMAASFL